MTIDDKRNELREICKRYPGCDSGCPVYHYQNELRYEICDLGSDEYVERIYTALHNSVNHPAHYSGKHECIEIMRVMFGDEAVKAFCRCNSFKYRFRAARKNGDEDIAKAEWYEEYLFHMEKGEKS